MLKLAETPEGQARLDRMNVRIEETATDAIEKAEKHPGPPAQGEIDGLSGRPDMTFLPFTNATTSLPSDARPPIATTDSRPPIAHETTTTTTAQIPDDMADHEVQSDRGEIPGGDTGESGGMDIGHVCHSINTTRNNDLRVNVDDDNPESFLRIFEPMDRAQLAETHREIESAILLIGGDTKKYRRERQTRTRAIVSEIYSAPRVTAMAGRRPHYGCVPGLALDLTTTDDEGNPWDFSHEHMRDKADKLLDEERPLFLIGSPMCTAFSRLLALSAAKRDPREIKRQYDRAMIHLEFCCKLYQRQVDKGLYFLHEHPALATSWDEACMKRLLARSGVERIVADQCQLGQETDKGEPIKKPTGFLSNSPELLKALHHRCMGRHGQCSRRKGGNHAPCMGQTAKRAAIYHDRMCEAILRGISSQMRADRRVHDGEIGTNIVMTSGNDFVADNMGIKRGESVVNLCDTIPVETQVCGSNANSPSVADEPGGAHYTIKTTGDRRQAKPPRSATDLYGVLPVSNKNQRTEFVDDLTGQPLPPELVREGRAKELAYFQSKEVWVQVPRSEAFNKTGRPPITVRWVNTNKGDHQNPNVRCRLVAREIRTPGMEAIFAPTPPLEALRTVLSCAVTQFPNQTKKTWDPRSEDRMQISLIDISRAYFNAHIDPASPTYVDFPPEMNAPPGTCARLKRHMYGTRKAAEGWQE